MKKSRFTEEQIIKALKRQESGEKVQDICRELGVSQQAFYKWKAKYGGLEVSEAQRATLTANREGPRFILPYHASSRFAVSRPATS